MYSALLIAYSSRGLVHDAHGWGPLCYHKRYSGCAVISRDKYRPGQTDPAVGCSEVTSSRKANESAVLMVDYGPREAGTRW